MLQLNTLRLKPIHIVWIGMVIAIAGCTSPQAQMRESSPPVTTPTAVSPTPSTPEDALDQEDWLDLLPGETVRDLSFTQTGALSYQGTILQSEIPVSTSSDGAVTYAKRLIVSPTSPSGRYTILKACEEVTDEGLCWAIYKVDRAQQTVQTVSIGKYGGLDWVQWSADDRYAVFLEKLEGTAWFIIMDLQSGESSISDEIPAQPELDSFTWTGDRTFTVTLADQSQFQGDIEIYFPPK
ncbi:hypothetical protein H6F93_21775 [Leptolyngbya sp. FACHB-671]|uniref:hypothetical protein n=1 Tax=Leptolyngbya sp. FACHB-671 TaxID=2692812 RepID=UPI0016829079|nr:hypothetical protein [Leptolyngbya sp. FACHB-671]MBD2070112.1 hypothetical protein [Leptolyngbya sp. FACHB-671]